MSYFKKYLLFLRWAFTGRKEAVVPYLFFLLVPLLLYRDIALGRPLSQWDFFVDFVLFTVSSVVVLSDHYNYFFRKEEDDE